MDKRGLVGMVVIVGAVFVAFLAARGTFSPHALTPAKIIDTFEDVNGAHPGFRRNHAKGIGIHGTFESNGAGRRLSKSVVFEKGSVPVTGRFALAGGMPYAPDDAGNVRSMALRFELPNGEEWRTGMNDIPVFPMRDAEAFHEQLLASKDPKTLMPPFLERHPETAKAFGLIKARTVTSGFADDTYNSLNTFLMVAENGTKTPVRWAMVSKAAAAPKAEGPNAVFDQLIAELHHGPLMWQFVMTIAGPEDAINDSTLPFPPDRQQIEVGTLVIDKVESEEGHEVRILNFDPLMLPSGIEPSDDPILSARSAAYSQSVRRRLGEPAPSSAVGPAEVAR